VDTYRPDAPVGPAELFAWLRYRGAPEDVASNQAILAWATDGFLIGTAMRPHAGVGQADAHKSLSTGVVGHTLTFHEPFTARDWLLLAHESPHAGAGRCYGRAHVFTRDGRLVASFVQDAMIRAAAPGGAAPRSAM
jgi:acyl-CoA thioesterase II